MNSRQVSSDTINDNYATIEASPPKSQILISYNLNLKVRPGHFEIIRFILRNTCLLLLPLPQSYMKIKNGDDNRVGKIFDFSQK